MVNLAGVKDCDKTILEELKIAGINPVSVGRMNNEVPASYIGVLNGFKFVRAWYYWVVTGDVPLEHAKKIYELYKEDDVRADGHCGNVAPETVSKRKNSDEYVNTLLEKHKKNPKEYSLDTLSNEYNKWNNENMDEHIVDCYHIDTQLGLNEFCEYIKQHNIQTELR